MLSNEKYFQGHLDHLAQARNAVQLPILRKDFIVDEYQIVQAGRYGADAVLLIVACLEQGRLRDLQGFAREIGLDVLVEVHDADEAVVAVRVAADLVGVNNRNLKDFSLSLDTTFDLLPGLLGAGRVVVSESGIFTREHCLALESAGVDAVLVGEALMTTSDIPARMQEFLVR